MTIDSFGQYIATSHEINHIKLIKSLAEINLIENKVTNDHHILNCESIKRKL